jgi:hypothetical protein
MLRTTKAVVGLAFWLSLSAPDAGAGFVTPVGLKPNDPFRVVFVTDSVTPATSGDISTYDNIVAADAHSAGLDTYNGTAVTWLAIASTETTDAVTRLPKDNVPIYLVDGTQVAASGADLWNTGIVLLLHQIDESPEGIHQPSEHVWTGTGDSGNKDYALGGPDSNNAAVGLTDRRDRQWVNYYALDNQTDALPLYGFSSTLTVPQPVPVPSTFALLAVGTATLLSYVWLCQKRFEPAAINA